MQGCPPIRTEQAAPVAIVRRSGWPGQRSEILSEKLPEPASIETVTSAAFQPPYSWPPILRPTCSGTQDLQRNGGGQEQGVAEAIARDDLLAALGITVQAVSKHDRWRGRVEHHRADLRERAALLAQVAQDFGPHL